MQVSFRLTLSSSPISRRPELGGEGLQSLNNQGPTFLRKRKSDTQNGSGRLAGVNGRLRKFPQEALRRGQFLDALDAENRSRFPPFMEHECGGFAEQWCSMNGCLRGATYWRGRTDGGARYERRRLASPASGRLAVRSNGLVRQVHVNHLLSSPKLGLPTRPAPAKPSAVPLKSNRSGETQLRVPKRLL